MGGVCKERKGVTQKYVELWDPDWTLAQLPALIDDTSNSVKLLI
jgi:hypothetical protein